MQRSYGTGNTGMLVSIDFQSHLSGAFNQKALLIRFLLCDSETSIFLRRFVRSSRRHGDRGTQARTARDIRMYCVGHWDWSGAGHRVINTRADKISTLPLQFLLITLITLGP